MITYVITIVMYPLIIRPLRHEGVPPKPGTGDL